MIVITGVSRGLGRALTEEYLNKGESVVGIGRHNTIIHKNYTFLKVDLSDLDGINHLDLSWVGDEVTLINNAGILGEISRISDVDDWDLEEVMKVNTVAPMLLAKRMYDKVAVKSQFTLVNISSGAANRAVPSWAAYCASKAALNMLSETFYLEETEKNNNCKVYAVAPGVIDTDMQKTIRNIDPEHFSSRDNFIALKKNDQLYSPKECAERLIRLLAQLYNGDVFYDLRNI